MKEIIERARMTGLAVSIIGGLFKIMHWTGGNILLIAGLGTLAMAHIVLGLIKPSEATPKKVMINYARNFSIAIILFGILFKTMHWPSSSMMLIGGCPGLLLSYVAEQFLAE